MTLENAERRSLLEEVAGQLPIFLPGLLFQTYSNYYQHPRVLEALGLHARAPYPLGHDLAVFCRQFKALHRHRVNLECMVLKPSMVTPGKESGKATPEQTSELQDEGIEVYTIPWVDKSEN